MLMNDTTYMFEYLLRFDEIHRFVVFFLYTYSELNIYNSMFPILNRIKSQEIHLTYVLLNLIRLIINK